MEQHMPDAMATGEIITLDDDVLTEILLRVPPKSVLRARAVSKHWRHMATSPCFLAAYSLRRPPEVIVFYAVNHGANPVEDNNNNSSKKMKNKYTQVVGAINLTAKNEDLVRRPLLHYVPDTLLLHALCDGLLLFRRGDERFLIWNPATRQGALLPSLPITLPHAFVRPVGFYFHRASGEYRVLCHVEQIHYVLSASAAEPQRLEVDDDSIVLPTCPGVALHGSLHWLTCPSNSSDPDKLVAFDTVSHKFRRMTPPLVPAVAAAAAGDCSSCYRAPHLFEMHGLLAASAVRDVPHLDVWVLQDYSRERWAWRLRITIPQAPRMFGPPFTASALGVLQGNILAVNYGCLVLLYDMVEKGKLDMLDLRTAGISAVCHQGIYTESLVSLTPTPP